MRTKVTNKAFDHSGSSFDSFLEEEGIRGKTETVALKRVLAWQLEQAIADGKRVSEKVKVKLSAS